ncbi:MAG: hypothetical protein H6651_19655 [Ardenticatenales bacterium]|nr:hypothetical protein [Ardenticatenales bacterium]
MLLTIAELKEYEVETTDGATGRISDLYVEDGFWFVRYLVVSSGTWLNQHEVLLLPDIIAEAETTSGRLHIKLTEQQLLDSPPRERHLPISRQYEEQLADHYGWARYWLPATLLGSGHAPTLPVTTTGEKPLTPSDGGEPVLRSLNELLSYELRAQPSATLPLADMVLSTRNWQLRYLLVAEEGVGDRPVSLDFVSQCSWEERAIQLSLTPAQIQQQEPYLPGPIIGRE